jgi:hypothetical protein
VAKAGPRGQNPGAAADKSLPNRRYNRIPRSMELAAGQDGETARGPGRDAKKARPPASGRSNTAKGDEQIPWTSPAARETYRRPGRENCPGAGPVRALPEEHQPRMTRTGDVSTAARNQRRSRAAQTPFFRPPETRGTKTARATRPPAWVPAGRNTTPERDGPGGRQPPDGTARPVNVEGMRAKPQERRPSRSVRRREGDGRRIDRAGDQDPPAVATRRVRERRRPTGDGTG